MRSRRAYTKPTDVQLVDGEVVLLGPGHLCGSMTAEAARETGRRLLDGADRAFAERDLLKALRRT